MKYFILILLLISGCTATSQVQEKAIYKGCEVYWQNTRGKIYKLNYSDIKVLGIDSIRVHYLEQNAER